MADRKIIESTLARTNLTDHDLANVAYSPTAVMPDVRVVKIGGQSVMDRGRAALFPILDELVAARKEGIQVVVLVGGGTRARHIYSIASELEMPVGVMATLGKYIPMQNARMLQMLSAAHGALYILPDDFENLPLYLQLGCVPVMSGMPPFGYWEKREPGSRIITNPGLRLWVTVEQTGPTLWEDSSRSVSTESAARSRSWPPARGKYHLDSTQDF